MTEMTRTRTRYVVKLTIGMYARVHNSWTQQTTDALPFDSWSAALAYAVYELDLSLEEFTIEPI